MATQSRKHARMQKKHTHEKQFLNYHQLAKTGEKKQSLLNLTEKCNIKNVSVITVIQYLVLVLVNS